MRYKNLVLAALCVIITFTFYGCGGGGDGGGATVDGTPDTATVRIALNTPVTNLGVLVFDLSPGSGATFSSVKGINEAADADYVGFLNPAVPSNTFTVLDVAGLNFPQNRDVIEFTYAISGVTTLPTFQVTGNVSATSATGANIPLTSENFVVTTQFN